MSNDERHDMAETLAILAEVAETPDPEPNSTIPTPNAPCPMHHTMWAAPPSPLRYIHLIITHHRSQC